MVVAQLLREKAPQQSNQMFWKVPYELFVQKEHFCDSVVADIGRNDFYKTVNDTVFSAVDLLSTKDDVLNGLVIKQSTVEMPITVEMLPLLTSSTSPST